MLYHLRSKALDVIRLAAALWGTPPLPNPLPLGVLHVPKGRRKNLRQTYSSNFCSLRF